jgi:hypothetical protein
VARTGRRRLTWVTALTVASLLVGSTALNALADNGHGGGNRGNGGQGNQEHGQVVHVQEHGGGGGDTHGNGHANASASDNHGNADMDRGEDNHGAANITVQAERVDEDNDADDLITPPARVTEEERPGGERPGKGCGDENHEHMGPPGNPDNDECPQQAQHADDDDNGGVGDSGED